MPPKIGYLLPTREQIMEGRPDDAASLLALAERAEALGYNSVWVGDSVLARPRHDPLTLLAGVAGRVPRVAARHRGAVAGAAQPGAAGASGRDAGPGVGGALHPGCRHRARRAEHPRRVRRLRRAVREARRADDGRVCGCAARCGPAKPVDWDGRWPVQWRRAGAGAAPAGRSADLDRRQHGCEPAARRQVVRRLVPQCARSGGIRQPVARDAGDRPRCGARSGATVGGDVPDARGG